MSPITTYSFPSRLSTKSSGLHSLPLVVHELVVAPSSTSPQSSPCIPNMRASPSFLEPSMGILTGKQTVNISTDKYKIGLCQYKKKNKACACLGAFALKTPIAETVSPGVIACLFTFFRFLFKGDFFRNTFPSNPV